MKIHFNEYCEFNFIQFSAIVDYKKRETSWPCVREQSVGEVLGIRNGTRKIIKEIERVACSPGIFIKEWRQLLSEEEVSSEEILRLSSTSGKKNETILFACFFCPLILGGRTSA